MPTRELTLPEAERRHEVFDRLARRRRRARRSRRALGTGLSAVTAASVLLWSGLVLSGAHQNRPSASAFGVAAVSVGSYHACALTTTGAVQCWGDNTWGQLGNGTRVGQSRPAAVTGLSSGVAAIAAGSGHTCALTVSGGVECWGYGKNGEIGNTYRRSQALVPADVASLSSGVAAISSGTEGSCALTTAGGVTCWGMLGDPRIGSSPVPLSVAGLSSGVVAISGGGGNACALLGTGGVTCWGSAKFGDGSPKVVAGFSSQVTAISAGGSHSCAVTAGGVECWGSNEGGVLGDGTERSSQTPVRVVGLASDVKEVAAGGDFTCALRTTGAVQCWGVNVFGQLGDGTTQASGRPADVVGLPSGAVAISAANSGACAVIRDGSVWCWGEQGHPNRAHPTPSVVPIVQPRSGTT